MRLKFWLIITFLLLSLLESKSQTRGCTDPGAVNFSPSALLNDGSCRYFPASVSPYKSIVLPEILSESSGLSLWNNQLWSHNDNDDNNLYVIDTLNLNLISSIELTGTINTDWEEITSDEEYLYVGDFGNNVDGSRKDLRILKIDKNSILRNEPEIDTIAFSWSDQDESDPYGLCNTDFDCEAFIAFGDSLYLFTKQWISRKTGIYSLPREPGNHTARLKMVYDSEGLITGATCRESENLIVLCGYDTEGLPFLILIYDFTGDDFLNGNKRKIIIDLPFHQIEGISTNDGLKYYISNERTSTLYGLVIQQKIHLLDLKPFLDQYLNGNSQDAVEQQGESELQVYPNPVSGILTIITGRTEPLRFNIMSWNGMLLRSGIIGGGMATLDISDLPAGIYQLRTDGRPVRTIRILKI